MALIRFYQRTLSPMKSHPTCRFTPSCSSYALEAFDKRGFFAGFALSFWRILRCSPLSPGGYDPVPETGFRTMPLRWSHVRRPSGETILPDETFDRRDAAADGDIPAEDVPAADAPRREDLPPTQQDDL